MRLVCSEAKRATKKAGTVFKNCLDRKYITKINAILQIPINIIDEFMGPMKPPRSLIITPNMNVKG